MLNKETRHVRAFRNAKLKAGEEIVAFLEGWIGDMMGTGEKTQRNGQFFLTTERACFYRKGYLGEVFETIPLSKITSVEVLTRMGYRLLRLHTSHDELAFKTFEPKDIFEFVYRRLEELRHGDLKEEHLPVTQGQREERECPHCAELILLKANICRYCGRDVRSEEDAKSSVTTSNEKGIRLACQCGARITAKRQLAGTRVHCPKCREPLNVPME